MKIIDIKTKIVNFERKKIFRIALGVGSSSSSRVYVKVLTDSGIYGLGEAAPNPLVTAETISGVIATLEYMKNDLIGIDPTDIASIHKIMDKKILSNTSAKAAIDIACYDIIGKAKNRPVHTLLGATDNSVVTDITIGIDNVENMVEESLTRVQEGFRALKIKCGIEANKDIEALRKIRKAVGDEIDIRIDANQGYNVATALQVIEEIEKLNVSEVEQPLPFWDIKGMAQVKKRSPLPIMADESVHNPQQARLVCEEDACDIINIKFMKCGGIYRALQISDIAKEFGKTCIVGCMSESKLSIAAAAAVVAAKDTIVAADLDSFFAFTNPEQGVIGGFSVDKDVLTLSSEAGYGFENYDI